MKKRIRKTGEIVDVISYNKYTNTARNSELDWVSYVDSKGMEHEHEKGLNIYWDFEDVEEGLSTDIDWEWRRYEISKNCIIGILGNDEMVDLANGAGLKKNCRDIPINVAEMAVAFADALIAELKKGVEK